MEFGFTYTYSAEHLQSLPEKHRKGIIRDAVDHLYRPVLVAATAGKTSHIVNIDQYLRKPHTYQPPYIVTLDDLLEGFRDKFPGCRVEYTETWEDVRPGVREQRTGILIDWSKRRNSVTIKL